MGSYGNFKTIEKVQNYFSEVVSEIYDVEEYDKKLYFDVCETEHEHKNRFAVEVRFSISTSSNDFEYNKLLSIIKEKFRKYMLGSFCQEVDMSCKESFTTWYYFNYSSDSLISHIISETDNQKNTNTTGVRVLFFFEYDFSYQDLLSLHNIFGLYKKNYFAGASFSTKYYERLKNGN